MKILIIGNGFDLAHNLPTTYIDYLMFAAAMKKKIGYAGGINPGNVADKLTFLMENEMVGDFWIDMESGVRTDDWFDIDKVRRVLEICEPIISKYK